MRTAIKLFLILLLPFITPSCISQKSYRQPSASSINRIIQEEEEFSVKKIQEIRRPIRIGLLLPLSGINKDKGKMFVKAAEIALFNIDNERIMLIPFDTKGTTFGAIEAIQNAKKEDVPIVIGPLFTSTTKAMINIANNNNITVFSLSSDESLLNTGAFVLGFMPNQKINKAVDYLATQQKLNFAAILPNNQYGATVSKYLKKAAREKDGKIISIEYYLDTENGTQKNIRKLMNSYNIPQKVYSLYEEAKMKDKNAMLEVKDEDKIYPNVIAISESGKELSRLVSLIDKYKREDGEYYIVNNNELNADEIGDYAFNGMMFVAPDVDLYNKFSNEFYSVYGMRPIRKASLLYDAIFAINDIVNSGEEDIKRESFIGYKEFKGVDGEFEFLHNGTVERKFYVMQVNNGVAEIIGEAEDEFVDDFFMKSVD